MFRIFFSLLVVVFLGACASGTQNKRIQKPLAKEGSQPLVFAALGADYTLPSRWSVTDHERSPGIAWIDFVDEINACSGSLVWFTTTDAKAETELLNENENRDTQGYTADNITVKAQKQKATWLETPVDMRILNLSTSGDRAVKVHINAFSVKQQLAFRIDFFCKTEGTEKAVLTSLQKVIESQKILSE